MLTIVGRKQRYCDGLSRRARAPAVKYRQGPIGLLLRIGQQCLRLLEHRTQAAVAFRPVPQRSSQDG